MRRFFVLVVLAWVALLPPHAAASQTGRSLRRARVALEGPLTFVELHAAGAGVGRIELDLVAGERDERVLACVPSSLAADEAPRVDVGGAGSARFLEWLDGDRVEEAEREARLGFGQRARPVPPAPLEGSGVSTLAGMLVALASLLFTLRLRARPWPALAAGSAGALLVVLVASPAERSGGGLLVIELEDQRTWALGVRVARTALELPAGWHGSVRTRPEGAALDVDLGGPGKAEGWILSSPAVELAALEPFEMPSGELARDALNSLVALEEVWLRSPDGRWSEHGAWPLGARLPPSGEGHGGPPGWLQPALPQGRGILIARLAPGQVLGPMGQRDVGTWLRWVGF